MHLLEESIDLNPLTDNNQCVIARLTIMPQLGQAHLLQHWTGRTSAQCKFGVGYSGSVCNLMPTILKDTALEINHSVHVIHADHSNFSLVLCSVTFASTFYLRGVILRSINVQICTYWNMAENVRSNEETRIPTRETGGNPGTLHKFNTVRTLRWVQTRVSGAVRQQL